MERFISLIDQNVSALMKMTDWRNMAVNFRCPEEEQKTVAAVCLSAFVTTMLNTVDGVIVFDDKEEFYDTTGNMYPSFRRLFNECLDFYNQIPHAFLEQMTTGEEPGMKLPMALLFGYTTWCLLHLECVEDPNLLAGTPDVLQFACMATYTASKELYGLADV